MTQEEEKKTRPIHYVLFISSYLDWLLKAALLLWGAFLWMRRK